jgi:Domain of unknown function (DUF4249)
MKRNYFFILLILLVACKEKYMPNIPRPVNGNLVVEGFINLGTGPTIIQLTRITGLDSAQLFFETGALVEVQSESGSSFPLTEQGLGRYSIDQVPLIVGDRYQLHIATSNGKEYKSDLSEVKITPPIDSLNWSTDGNQVLIFVSTHDDQNQTKYYQWQFEETWVYTAFYRSVFVYQDSSIITRPDNEQIFNCWRSDFSKTISIASSANLTQDLITRFPLTNVSILMTDKLVVRYSILVKQYALSQEWYEWNEKIKKNTEQLGSIFDAQPSGTGGNVHCITDPKEAVVGFVGCTTETDKRIFIDHSEVPGTYNHGYPVTCALDTIPFSPYDAAVFAEIFSNPANIPVDYEYFKGFPVGITYSDTPCTDCNLQGGISIKPDFWQ